MNAELENDISMLMTVQAVLANNLPEITIKLQERCRSR